MESSGKNGAIAPIGEKVFNDPVHGYIKLHPLCVSIIDTPEFQRLRNLKQVGPVYYVYPGASHNRFEHSLGVCYLAGKMIEAITTSLKRDKSDIEVTEEEKLCIEIAGLVHDLGHGPFSHTWERFLRKKNIHWRHEESSLEMFIYLIAKNKLEGNITSYIKSFSIEEFKELIGCLIINGMVPKLQRLIKLKEEKEFLFNIVSNNLNGIDVDRWDYFLRDGLQLNIKFTFDYHRLLEFCRVMTVMGKKVVCFRKKVAQHIYDMFLTRAKLHVHAYQHHVASVIEEMMVDAFVLADENFQFGTTESKLSQAHESADLLMYLTDHVFYNILYGTNDEARTLLERILKRDLYPSLVGGNFSARLWKSIQEESFENFTTNGMKEFIKNQEEIYRKKLEEDIRDICNRINSQGVKLKLESFEIRMVKVDLGIELEGIPVKPGKKINPFANIYFYEKDGSTAKEIDWSYIPLFPTPEESICRIEGLIIYRNISHDENDSFQAFKTEWERIHAK